VVLEGRISYAEKSLKIVCVLHRLAAVVGPASVAALGVKFAERWLVKQLVGGEFRGGFPPLPLSAPRRGTAPAAEIFEPSQINIPSLALVIYPRKSSFMRAA